MEEKWKTEVSSENFQHKGISCLLIRQTVLKYWMGYIAVPKDHPWWGAHSAELGHIPIHGKVQVADEKGVLSEPDGNWWIGFNCGHPFDLIPYDYEIEGAKYPGLFKNHIYRDIDFAREQLKILAEYAAKA